MSDLKSRDLLVQIITDQVRAFTDAPMAFIRLDIERHQDGRVMFTPYFNTMNAAPADLVGFADGFLTEARERLDQNDHPLCDTCVRLRKALDSALALLVFEPAEPDSIGTPKGNA